MSHLVVALDAPCADAARQIVSALGPLVEWYKVGSVLFTAEGPSVVADLKNVGKRVFLDLKFFDIPSTVGGAVGQACRLGADLLTVHLLGGRQMVVAAAEARDAAGTGTRIVGVTVLTSWDDSVAREVGVSGSAAEAAARLAGRAREWGADGVVCAPADLRAVRMALPEPSVIVCPGIRSGRGQDDQRRTGTACDAARNGADFIVVGRPITASADPAAAAEAILEEMKRGETGVDSR